MGCLTALWQKQFWQKVNISHGSNRSIGGVKLYTKFLIYSIRKYSKMPIGGNGWVKGFVHLSFFATLRPSFEFVQLSPRYPDIDDVTFPRPGWIFIEARATYCASTLYKLESYQLHSVIPRLSSEFTISILYGNMPACTSPTLPPDTLKYEWTTSSCLCFQSICTSPSPHPI